MTSTALDTALSKLADVFAAAAASTDVKVFDGEPIEPPAHFLCVGWDESGDRPAVQVVRNGVGLVRAAETYEVACMLSWYSGTQTGSQMRGDLTASFEVFDEALAANRRLDGTVLMSEITDYQYLRERRDEGVYGAIPFTVTLTTNSR